jgi:hypothetical protein
MKLKIIFLFSLTTGFLFSQNTNTEQKSISAVFGIGNNHLTDEYISKNEYTGISNSYGLEWIDRNNSRLTGVGFDFKTINNLKNMNNVAATYDFLIHYKYLYNIYSGKLFARPINIFLGPDFGFCIHYRDQKVAYSSQALSLASLFSANAALCAVGNISESFSISGNLSLSVLSFTIRTPSLEDANHVPTPVALLGIPKAVNLNTSVFANYSISENFTFQLGYRLMFLEINKWDYFRLINDNVIIQCGVNF